MARRAGNQDGERRRCHQRHGNADEGDGVGGGHAPDQVLQEAREQRSRCRVRRRARATWWRRPRRRIMPSTRIARRAQGHANADLVRLLLHQVGHHAVDADAGEHQRQHAEYAHQHRDVDQAQRLIVNQGVHGADIGDGLLGIDRAYGGGDRRAVAVRDRRWCAARCPSTAADPARRARRTPGADCGRRRRA